MLPRSTNKRLPSWGQRSTTNHVLALARRRVVFYQQRSGPFVYRLGHQVFNLVRGVRLPYGLPLLSQTVVFTERYLW